MHYGVTEPSFATELKQDADGVCGLVDWTPEFPYRDEIFGTAQEYADKYEAKYKRRPTTPRRGARSRARCSSWRCRSSASRPG